MFSPLLVHGEKALGRVGSAIFCMILLVVYRKLNGIPFDKEDFHEVVRVFGGYAAVAVLGALLVVVFDWIFHT